MAPSHPLRKPARRSVKTMSIDHSISQPTRILPRTMEDVLRGWIWRGTGLAVVLATAAAWLALLSWSANDPSLSNATSEPTTNLLGPFGAVVADFLLHALGLSAIFFLVPPLVCGLQIAMGERIGGGRLRIALFVLSTVAIAGGCSALPLSERWPMDLGYGGILGDFTLMLGAGLLSQFNVSAATALVGLVCFSVGFWAFSRVIGLDRCNIFDVALPSMPKVFGQRGRSAAKPDIRMPQAGHGHHVETAPAVKMPTRPAPAPEPAPPSWAMNDRLVDVDPVAAGAPNDNEPLVNIAQTRAATEPTVPTVQAHPHEGDDEDSYSIARRFAPAATADTATAEAEREPLAPTSPVSLMDEDEDLPMVLRRAKAEPAPEPNKRREWFPRLQPESKPVERPAPPALRAPGVPNGHPASAQARGSTRQLPPMPKEAAPVAEAHGYRRPSLNLLNAPAKAAPSADMSQSVLHGNARRLEDVLSDFRISGEIKHIRPGPVITQFELEPARGTKSSRVIALADDVARSMSAASARIAVVPGRNAIGIELPNARRQTFGLRELMETDAYRDGAGKLPLVLGKGTGGEPVLADLSRMPHLLVAGTTGSGKSVGINAMILSLIYKLGPESCRFLMIDPKMLELSVYNGIPHLLTPVITDPQKAVAALNWAVGEMEERYKRMSELGVRNIDAFNNRVRHAARNGEKLGRTVQTGFDANSGKATFAEVTFDMEPLPHIVVVVDEFADLMAVAGKEIEALIQRLAQMARAAGIHLIMATQRPSVDVVTGTIKANFPTRISYRVASRIDSRTILNEQGAEQLLGQGDMLYAGEAGQILRVHGPFVSDEEIEAITTALRQSGSVNYVPGITDTPEASSPASVVGSSQSNDLYERAVAIVMKDRKASTSYLQRRMAIGYNRAANLIEQMEANGVIGPANHAGKREVISGDTPRLCG